MKAIVLTKNLGTKGRGMDDKVMEVPGAELALLTQGATEMKELLPHQEDTDKKEALAAQEAMETKGRLVLQEVLVMEETLHHQEAMDKTEALLTQEAMGRKEVRPAKEAMDTKEMILIQVNLRVKAQGIVSKAPTQIGMNKDKIRFNTATGKNLFIEKEIK